MAPQSVMDVMTRKFVGVSADAPLAAAAKLLVMHDFHGVPVVDTENHLLGILTDYDLISKESFVHLPTLQSVLEQLHVESSDRREFEEEIKEIRNLRVKDVMNKEPLTLPNTASYEQTVKAFREHHRVNPIPVIDAQNRVVGVVSRFDLLRQVGS